jgi:drug/metabolite transporter (DMT)-like permease
LLAAIISSIIAFGVEDVPGTEWSPLLIGALAFAGVFGTAFAYWAMAVANRSLPAVTTSLVLLATPVVGVVCSSVLFDEAVTPSLIVAMTMILGGTATGVFSAARSSSS